MSQDQQAISSFKTLGKDLQISSVTLAPMETGDLIALLDDQDVAADVKKFIVEYFISQRIEYDSTQPSMDVSQLVDKFLERHDRNKISREALDQLSTRELLWLLIDPRVGPAFRTSVRGELDSRNSESYITDIENKQESYQMRKNYPALKKAALILKIVGWIVVVAGIISTVHLLARNQYRISHENTTMYLTMNAVPAVVSALATLILSVFLFAIAEFLILCTDVASDVKDLVPFTQSR